MAPHDVSDMAELALPGGRYKPSASISCKVPFFDSLCSWNYAKICGGKKNPTNPPQIPFLKTSVRTEGAAGPECCCWLEKPQVPRTPNASGTQGRFIYSPPIYPPVRKFPTALQDSGCSSISSHRSIRLSRSFSRNYLVKHMTVPGWRAIRDRHSLGSRPVSWLCYSNYFSDGF